MKKLLVFIFFISKITLSQNLCGTDEYNKDFITNNPSTYTQIERSLQKYLSNNKKSKTQITIPVVFHVVWINKIQNLHDSIIHQQLEVLNSIFNAQNADTSNLTDTLKNWVGNFNINFEIAHRDPEGLPTYGITRKKTIQPSFSYWNDPVKKSYYGTAPWPTNRYLNIWICDLNGGLKGYAQFPGGPNETDGVVIDWQTVGNQIYPWTSSENYEWSRGKVLVHEIGHWLNLYHPWGNTYSGCGEDHIPEIHKQFGPIYPGQACPDTMFSSCSDSGRLFIKHYMDYAGSSCMCTFTKNQVLRGLASLNTYRTEMINSYNPQIAIEGFENIKIYPTSFQDKFYIEFPEYEGEVKIFIHNIQGKLILNQRLNNKWFHVIYPYSLTPGIYIMSVSHNQKIIFTRKIVKQK